jgi:predicted nuclease of predicted toxin-antitoxin system
VALGWDVVHVGDLGMATASDKEILGRALVERRAVVTLDADFHTILALENASGPSVIRIRIEGPRGPELAALIRRAVEACPDRPRGRSDGHRRRARRASARAADRPVSAQKEVALFAGQSGHVPRPQRRHGGTMPSEIRFVVRELAALARMDVQMLRAWYGEVFADATTTRNAASLRRRLAWWIQWQAEDRLPEHILAHLADLRRAVPLRARSAPGTGRISLACERY